MHEHRTLIIIGFTGSVTVGKSFVAGYFSRMSVPIFDADSVVHDLYRQNASLVKTLGSVFPGSVISGCVDRKVLFGYVLKDISNLQKLERIVHPFLRNEINKFLCVARRKRIRAVILDVPLLFECRLEDKCEFTVSVFTSETMQKYFAQSKRGMCHKKYRIVKQRQMSQAKKKAMADFIVGNGMGAMNSHSQLDFILKEIGRIKICKRVSYNFPF